MITKDINAINMNEKLFVSLTTLIRTVKNIFLYTKLKALMIRYS